MSRMLWRLGVEESGQDLVEYALLASLLAMLTIAALTFVGEAVAEVYKHVASTLGA